MKIDDNQPPVDDPSLNTDDVDIESDDVDSQSTRSDDEPSAFSQLLAKKKAQDRETASAAASARAEKKKEGPASSSAGFMQQPIIRDVSGGISGIDKKQAVSLPPDLQQLVREISVATNKAGHEQVHIEMNSNVLKGLQIQIERQNGELAVHFVTDSQQVSGLLSRNVDLLSQSLSSLGEKGVDIRITGTTESAKTWAGKYRGNQGGRGQSGYGGGRR
jgi:hypothetical protein